MKKYNSEFKSMVVELYKTGHAVKIFSRECGISEVTIHKWIKQLSLIASIDDTELTLEKFKHIKKCYVYSRRVKFKKGYDYIRKKESKPV